MKRPTILADRWRVQLSQLVDTLRAWPWRETAHTLHQRFREDRLGVTASSLTFTTVISLVPLLTVMLAIFSAFPMFAQLQRVVERYFLQTLVPDSIARPVLGALTQFASQSNRLGAVGVAVLVITALALMLTIDRTLNAIWRVRKPRPMAQRVLIYWAAATLGPLLLGASLSFTSYAISASQGYVGKLPELVNFLLGTVEFGLLVVAIAGLFHFVPNTHVRWQHALAGGLFVAVGFEVAKRILAWYVIAIPTYSMIYGAFATLPIFLVWLYAGWVIVLTGAVITAHAPNLQMRVVRQPGTPGWRFALAVMVLRLLLAARGDARRGLGVQQMGQSLRTDPLQIEPIVELLIELDWVARLDEPGAPRYVLLCDVTTTPARPLVERLLLKPDVTLAGLWERAGVSGWTLATVMDA